MKVKHRSSINYVYDIESYAKSLHPSLKSVKQTPITSSLSRLIINRNQYINAKRKLKDCLPPSLAKNRQSVVDTTSAVSLSSLKKTRETSLCAPSKESTDAGFVIMEKLCQITDRLDTFLENDKNKSSKNNLKLSQAPVVLPDIKRLGLTKCRPRLSDAGLQQEEVNEEIKTFNIDGIHFEVSAQKNQVTSSYLPQMNLIHYNFARSSIKPRLKPKKTESYLKIASSSGKLKTYQPQLETSKQKKSHKIFIRPDFKLKPLASHKKPSLQDTSKHCNSLEPDNKLSTSNINHKQFLKDSGKTLQEKQYKGLKEGLLNLDLDIHENINELSSEEDK